MMTSSVFLIRIKNILTQSLKDEPLNVVLLHTERQWRTFCVLNEGETNQQAYCVVQVKNHQSHLNLTCTGKRCPKTSRLTGLPTSDTGGTQCKHVRMLFEENEDSFFFDETIRLENRNQRITAISHRSIPPPLSAELSSDRVINRVGGLAAVDPATKLTFNIDEHARCNCGLQFDPTSDQLLLHYRDAILYTETIAYVVSIQCAFCRMCNPKKKNHRFIGPDLSDKGIFNMNNRSLFSHRFLDEFTESLTIHETTIDAFVRILYGRYIEPPRNAITPPSQALFARVRSLLSI